MQRLLHFLLAGCGHRFWKVCKVRSSTY